MKNARKKKRRKKTIEAASFSFYQLRSFYQGLFGGVKGRNLIADHLQDQVSSLRRAAQRETLKMPLVSLLLLHFI